MEPRRRARGAVLRRAAILALGVVLVAGCANEPERPQSRFGTGERSTEDLTESNALSDAALARCLWEGGDLAIVEVTGRGAHSCGADQHLTFEVLRSLLGHASGTIEAATSSRFVLPQTGYFFLVQIDRPVASYHPPFVREVVQLNHVNADVVIAMHEARLDELRRRSTRR